jgi:hypothetical protein
VLGPLAELGITMPKAFTVEAVLDLVLQILGITKAKLRSKLEKIVGPTAVSILEKAWAWISALVTGGVAGLWAEIKTQLANLWDLVIGGISGWVTTKVILPGIARLAAMANPIGAIVKAIQTIYDTITFIVTKANRILALVDAVVSSLSDIAHAKIAGAAALIQNALGKGVSLLISFIADWLGIPSPGEAIAGIVKQLQAKIDAALDWLVGKAIAIAKGAAALFGFGEKPDQRTPEEKQRDVNAAVDEIDAAARAEGATYDGVAARIPGVQKRYRVTSLTMTPLATGDVDILGEINPKAEKKEKLPPPVPTAVKWFGLGPSGGGVRMVANPLTYQHPQGSVPSASWPLWETVRPGNLRRDKKGLYIRGHLLNNQLGGPGTEENLTPITYRANRTHEAVVESKLKTMVNQEHRMVYYDVNVGAPAGTQVPPDVEPDEARLPTFLRYEWKELLADKSEPHKLVDGPEKGSGVVQNVPPWPHADDT